MLNKSVLSQLTLFQLKERFGVVLEMLPEIMTYWDTLLKLTAAVELMTNVN